MTAFSLVDIHASGLPLVWRSRPKRALRARVGHAILPLLIMQLGELEHRWLEQCEPGFLLHGYTDCQFMWLGWLG